MITEDTKKFIVWARNQNKSDDEIVSDLMQSGWVKEDARRALQEFLSEHSAGGEEVKDSFIKKNIIVFILGVIALVILIGFGVFVLVTR